ncbi:hypothetical protein HGP17_23670 [Rhizobium sp. P38BS-XIX]|uniref:hypothetical protein n=1 Tax=Rhizobium sp. P38BS-XIX TaxID=2726740 RepID=UPI0014566C85|nr:hypothetical protein [Rhizobium sp. P38BS-XIX]NLR99832.1 hypothetical protein [Rhizobium sp. P38BS-XIX]
MSCWPKGKTVEKVGAIAATSATSGVEVCRTTSITSDPQNRWIAHRQSAITATLSQQGTEGFSSSTMTDVAQTAPSGERRLSGESERIGKGNWDEISAFGRHVGYL